MYELINAAEYGYQTDRPLMIVRREDTFRGKRSVVFTMTVHSYNDALEILHALNNPEPDNAA